MAEQFEQGVSIKEDANRLRNLSMPITVFLTDDKEVMRTAIRLLLSSDPGVLLVGEATTFRQMIQCATDLKPLVVVMDLHMADELYVSSREVKSLLKASGAQLIAISFWNDEETQALAESFGAVTFLDKLTLATELIPAIKAASMMERSASA